MKRTIGVYTNAYGTDGVRAAAKRVREAGIDRLELAMKAHNLGGLVIPESAVVTENADDATATAFCALLRDEGVTISGCNVGGADLRTAEGVELTERRIAFAKRWFEVPVVISGAGRPTNADERGLVIEHLRRLGDFASRLGVIVALETHAGPTQNADAMLALMSELDHPAVRLNFDTGNIAYYNRDADPVAELRRVAPFVRNVHLKDNRGGFEDWYFPAPGEGGSVDFQAVREILDEVGFTGPYTIEIEGIEGEPEPGLDERSERVIRGVEHLRSCEYFD